MKFISEITVNLEQVLAEDELVLRAARVSTKGDNAAQELVNKNETKGLINYLMAHRHGTPFEHNLFTFFVHAPIFVWREWHRHRIGFSYNEESARYKVLEPVFYIPPSNRPMFKVENWKPGKPKFMTTKEMQYVIDGENDYHEDYAGVAAENYTELINNLQEVYQLSYNKYQQNLDMGFDPGLARDCLPVGIYSSCWVSCNARSLMSFLSLRTHNPDALKVSYPLYEIEVAASKLEALFSQYMPLTHEAFCANGRLAP